MKKSKLLVLALVAVLLTVGLVLASCRAGCEGAGTCEIKDEKGSVCTNEKCDVWKSGREGKDGKCDC